MKFRTAGQRRCDNGFGDTSVALTSRSPNVRKTTKIASHSLKGLEKQQFRNALSVGT